MAGTSQRLCRIARCSRWGLRAVLLCLLLGPAAATAGGQSPVGRPSGWVAQGESLPYTQSNADAGAASRYGLRFPSQPAPTLAPGASWILVFDAELDVDAFRRRLRLCYSSDRVGRLPSHQHCVQEIPAAFRVQKGQGEDSISIIPQQVIDQQRTLMVWVDLINPIEPGTYPVQLFKQERPALGSWRQPLGHWLIRIDYPSFDSPGSGE